MKIIAKLFAIGIVSIFLVGCGNSPSSVAKKVTIDNLYRVTIMQMARGGFVPTAESSFDSQRRQAYRETCEKSKIPLYTPLEDLLRNAKCFDEVKYDVKSLSQGRMELHRIDFTASKTATKQGTGNAVLVLSFEMGTDGRSPMEIEGVGGTLSINGKTLKLSTKNALEIVCDDLVFPEKSELIKKIKEQ